MDSRIFTDYTDYTGCKDCTDVYTSYDTSTSSPITKDEKITSLENEIAMLHNDLWNYKNELERLMEIVSEFQHIYKERTHQTELEINTMYENLNRHVNSFHAMLIIGNKDGEKSESNIS